MSSSGATRQIVERVRTPFNQGAVVARGQSRHLEVSGATYASYHPQRRFWGYAWDALALAAVHHPKAATGGVDMRILLIGLGGGTALHALRMLLPRCELIAAEIDSELVGVTERHFALADTGARVVVGDGYAHLDDAGPVYDVIIDDAFLARGEAVRTEDMTGSLMERLMGGLSKGGMLASNFFSDRANVPPLLRARTLFMQGFLMSLELAPPLGHNAILCGADEIRPPAAVTQSLEALPPRHVRAALQVETRWSTDRRPSVRTASRAAPGI